MSYLDSKYLNLASSQLQKFKKVKPGLWTFRCPYCGDSKKHKNKTRGYVFQAKGDHVYKCHNCGISRSFANFLKEQNEDLYNEYLMERYREGIGGRNVAQPDLTQFVSKPVFKPRPIDLEKVSDLNSLHQARAYLLGRGIPEDKLHLFYYCPKFKKWTNKQKEVFADTKNDDDRIIIPLIDQDGKLFGFQGRSLDFNAKMRYITVMLARPVVRPGKAAINKTGINGIKRFLDANNGAGRKNFKGYLAASQGGDVVHEVPKHLHFGGLYAEHGLDFDVDFLCLSHNRRGQHRKANTRRSHGRSHFGEF